MPISTAPSRVSSTRSGSTRARSAAPGRGCWSRRAIADAFIEKLKARLETLRVGHPLDKAIDVGAIVAPVQLERIRALVKKGEEEGATVFQARGELPERGYYFPPTLMANVQPASTCARVEIFGPVLVAMTFRTPDEAVALANNTEYGLAASVWSESINLALDIAPKLKAGVVWVNSTNLFDASSGFGGYKESGYGREGGREGLAAYTKPRWMKGAGRSSRSRRPSPTSGSELIGGSIDRTAKMYIGGKQQRPDGGYSRPIASPCGGLAGEVGEGNRKDIRNAVEAARKAAGWATATEHSQGADPLLHRRESRAPARPSSPIGCASCAASRAPRRASRSTRRSSASSRSPPGRTSMTAPSTVRRSAGWRSP